MKTILFTLTMFFIMSVSIGQTYQSTSQAQKTSYGNISIKRDNMVFKLDLQKLTIDIKSSTFMGSRSLKLIESRIMHDEQGEHRFSQYQINPGNDLYIMDSKTERVDGWVHYYKMIVFVMTDEKTGVQSFLSCYISAKDPDIVYNSKTVWANYQTFQSNYQWKGNVNTVWRKLSYDINIDLINNLLLIGNGETVKIQITSVDTVSWFDKKWLRTSVKFSDHYNSFVDILDCDSIIRYKDDVSFNKAIILSDTTTTVDSLSKWVFFINDLTPIKYPVKRQVPAVKKQQSHH